jgi:prolyl 4-hydroxylase
MGGITQLSSEWDQWMILNTRRGVPFARLVEDMVRNGFDRGFAESAVSQCSTRHAPNVASASRDRGRLGSGSHIDIGDHRIAVVSRIKSPDIAVIDHAMSNEECDELIALSRTKLARSTIVDPLTGSEMVIGDRSSEGTYFMRGENALVARIEQRLSELSGVPVENGEGLQILHYSIGGEYKPHFDFFEPEHAGSAVHLEKGGQRVSTTILYLNDVEAGGETIFPEITLSVTPRKGAAVHFSYYDDPGVLDRRTLHGGAPVRSGEKWIATKWVRQRPHISPGGDQ